MRAVVQRVRSARVEVNGKVTGGIGRGLLVFLGVSKEDTESQAAYLVDKITNLRIFEDADGKMNLSVREDGRSLLVVSQFTLYADTSRGRRPSFDAAAPASDAKRLYEHFIELIRATGLSVETGIFQAKMMVHLENDGPVTLICDSPAN